MSKKISGAEYPLAKIFSSEFDYVIPPYQRPYAWTRDQAGELFDDLYDFFEKEVEDSYFLGSVVLIKDEGKPLAEVIDGQQRLTTLTILLATLTAQLTGDNFSSFYSFIREPGNVALKLNPKPRLALRERDRAFFAQHVQGLKFDDLTKIDPAQLENESQRNIQGNARLLLERLATKFTGNESSLVDFGSFLLMRCFLVAVTTPSQQSAFRVFSVLNNRGLDLLPTDIIKAEVIGKLAEDKRDDFNDRWEELEVATGRDGFNELFGHIRMIYARFKARRMLLEEFREHVLNKVESSEALIDKIVTPYAQAYLVAKNAQYVSSTNAGKINELFTWLNRIDNSDWVPVAIAFLARHGSDANTVLDFVTRLERLAAYLHITARNVNQRIERYAHVLEDIFKGVLFDRIELTPGECVSMLRELDGNVYELTARRRNYLILRLDSFVSAMSANYTPNVLTIEHVLPQTVDANSEWARAWPDVDERARWLHRLANLVPLTRARNSKALNYDFDRKKSAYFAGNSGVNAYALTSQVLHEAEWTPVVAERRQKSMLEVLKRDWRLV
ncbi:MULTISPECIES: DUF262 domain-containing protein [unclassified Pseudomonas]|uniref:DUF262 domain-containing protein n=1 Tax=unclassified Pseudomonas TaxID=196821 RepID=UPI000876AD90|nr:MULTISPECIES: DUF262 domain-containing protein [unclassified Pseudomonas]SCZ33308.1 Protein of unknown function [Pseudomonas sp. NFACC44-2]SDA79884.1 Protein of unknown function [Pseudomonas sp. NFACC51]SFH66730.1 Protein of unknown function [Pseudomonas sp. NFACC54]SFT17261.1 Protein of unknown function [Pseudomonas sp. NFACC48-1]